MQLMMRPTRPNAMARIGSCWRLRLLLIRDPPDAVNTKMPRLSMANLLILRGMPSDAIMAGREHNHPSIIRNEGMRRRFGTRGLYRADHYQLHSGWLSHSARAQRRLAEPRLKLDLPY